MSLMEFKFRLKETSFNEKDAVALLEDKVYIEKSQIFRYLSEIFGRFPFYQELLQRVEGIFDVHRLNLDKLLESTKINPNIISKNHSAFTIIPQLMEKFRTHDTNKIVEILKQNFDKLKKSSGSYGISRASQAGY